MTISSATPAALPETSLLAVDLTGVHKRFGQVKAVAWLVLFAGGAVWRMRKDTARV